VFVPSALALCLRRLLVSGSGTLEWIEEDSYIENTDGGAGLLLVGESTGADSRVLRVVEEGEGRRLAAEYGVLVVEVWEGR
jgi:hypothetical protein